MACTKHYDRVRRLQLGCGLIEVLVAVLVFSTGMMGLAAAQLVGKKAGYEATQRSIATTLVVDILERIRANPGELAAYATDNVGDEGAGMPLPVIDCALWSCLPGEMAAYDLWQWESLLLGSAEQEGTRHVGGLVSGRACIFHDRGGVSVAVSWRGVGPAGDTQASSCGSETAGLYDDPSGPPGNDFLRRSSAMFSYVGAN